MKNMIACYMLLGANKFLGKLHRSEAIYYIYIYIMWIRYKVIYLLESIFILL